MKPTTYKRSWSPTSSALLALHLIAWSTALQAAEPSARCARFVATWGEQGSEPGQFDFPIGVAINAADEVFVTDHYNNRVQKFDRDGKLLAHFAVLPNPGGIAVDRDGNLYIGHFPVARTSKERHPDRVAVYDTSGKRLRQWGKTGTQPGEFDFVGGIVIGPEGLVYVADQTNRRVQVFERDGRFVRSWGKYGTAPGEFDGKSSPKSRTGGPNFLAFDSRGRLFTTEAVPCRVQHFTAEGKPLGEFIAEADRDGEFGGEFPSTGGLRGPIGICIDRDDRLWICSVAGRVQQFTAEGKFLQGFGADGDEPGQFYAPHGIALDGRGDLYIVDAYNHRIQKFAVTP